MKCKKHQRQHGFTLLELLLVIVMIGILASVSASRYQEHIKNNNRRAAIASLQLIQHSMERAFLRNNTYQNALSLSQIDAFTSLTSISHTIVVNNATTTGYSISAEPIENDTKCGILSIDQSGRKTASGTANLVDCWE